MTDIETKNERRSRASRVDVILITSVGCRGSCASPRRFFGSLSPSRAGVGLLPMGPAGHDGRFARSSSRVARRLQRDAGEGRLRALAAREELRRFLAHLPQRALHARARARASRLARDGGGPRQSGAPSRGGPVRAEVAAALEAPGSLESIATLVSSPNRDASPRVPRPRRAPPPPLAAPPPRDRARPSPSPSPTAPPAPTPARRRPRGRVRAPPPQPRRTA